MSIEKVQVENFAHYSTHESYVGPQIAMKDRKRELSDRHRFRKSTQEKVETLTEEMKWREEMKNKYGNDWKVFMKKNKLYN